MECIHGLGIGNHVVRQQSLPCHTHVFEAKDVAFARIPPLKLGGGRLRAGNLGVLVYGEPMHRGEQLQAIGRLESGNQTGDLLETLLGLRIIGHKLARRLRRAGQGLDRRPLCSVTEATNETAFHELQDMIQVVGVRSILVLHVVQPQRLSNFLQQVGQLLSFQPR